MCKPKPSISGLKVFTSFVFSFVVGSHSKGSFMLHVPSTVLGSFLLNRTLAHGVAYAVLG